LRTIETEELSAVESQLGFENKNYILSAMQMQYIVDPALSKFVVNLKNSS
jgi:hypothetical protein